MFPDPVSHFGAPWWPFWILQAVRRCRRWAIAPFSARLVFDSLSFIFILSYLLVVFLLYDVLVTDKLVLRIFKFLPQGFIDFDPPSPHPSPPPSANENCFADVAIFCWYPCHWLFETWISLDLYQPWPMWSQFCGIGHKSLFGSWSYKNCFSMSNSNFITQLMKFW